MISRKRRRGKRKRINKRTVKRLSLVFILSVMVALSVAVISGSLPDVIKKFNIYKGFYYPHDKERIKQLLKEEEVVVEKDHRY